MQIQQSPPPTTAARSGPLANRSVTEPSVDFQSFLRLLTAQLRNQDPLSPLDSTQFVAQLANFSTVEQLVSVNSRLDRLAEGLGDRSLENFTSWIGRAAEVRNTAVQFIGSPIPFRVEPPPGAVEAYLIGRDSSGAEVFRTPISNASATQVWDGRGGRTGEVYLLEVSYLFENGATITGSVNTFDTIEAVRDTEDGAKFLLASGVSVPRASIVGIGQ